jgi:hypothetical protein
MPQREAEKCSPGSDSPVASGFLLFLADAPTTDSGDHLALPPPAAGLPHGVFASSALNRPLIAPLTLALGPCRLAASGWGCA